MTLTEPSRDGCKDRFSDTASANCLSPVSSTQLLAVAAGLAFTSGAFSILLHDVVVLGRHWTMAHTLAVLTVVGVILAGELARAAWSTKNYGASLGFALAVLTGTALVVYNSVGRQAEVADTSVLSVEERNDKRADVKVKLAKAEAMLEEERAAHARESKRGGCKAICKGIEASLAVYEAAVNGYRGDLDKLGPPEPVAPQAERFAEILALFGANKAQTKAATILLEPFIYTLMFEFGSIVAWGYAFRSRATVPLSPATDARVKPLNSKAAALSLALKPSPRSASVVPFHELKARSLERKQEKPLHEPKARPLERDAALADLLSLGAVPSQESLAERWHRSEATVSRWVRLWEAQGQIRRKQHGRCVSLGS